MAKVRIYEWAKQNKQQSATIVKILNEKGHKVRNHTSSIDEEILIDMFLKKEVSKPKEEVISKPKEEVVSKPKTTTDKRNDSTNSTEKKPYKKPFANSVNKTNQNTTNSSYKYNNNNSNNTNNNNPNNNNNNNNNKFGNKGPNDRNNNNRSFGDKPRGTYKPNNTDNKFGNKKPYTPNKFNNVKKVEEEKPTEELKKPTKKTVNNTKKKPKYDRFKIFDKEEISTLENGKTKTQIKKEAREQRQKEKQGEINILTWSDDMTVAKFASEIDIPVTDVIAKLFELGIMATVNQNLSLDIAEVLTTEYNVEIKEDTSNSEYDIENLLPEFEESKKQKRPPVVTVMGHVDHGKTTLLDKLRSANVANKEAGGITQHIGAYQIVAANNEKITFLDTPGHAAFSEMRVRGANITDIIILVVAADDGIMPQTIEAIQHAKAANTPIIVAVNKMDKPGASADRILGELAEHGLMAEEWGGEVPVVKISALTGEGLDQLLDYIKVIAELNDYKASFEGPGVGTVIEAHLDKGRGPVATILLEEGTLKLKDSIVIGDTWGTIRVLQDEYGKGHKEIEPSMPVEITGLKEVPQAGDKFFVAENSKEAQLIGEKRSELKRTKERGSAHALSLEELNNMIEQGEVKELPVIIKADVQGTSEALASSLEKIEVNGVKVRIVAKGVGAITESDVLLATANNTIIIGFNVRPDAVARKKIEKEKVELIVNNVIYKIIEQIEDSMQGMKEKKYTEDVSGTATVQEVFKISDIGKVAGAIVTKGKINKKGKMRLIREGVVLYDGEIGQLKRFKDDVQEVIEGQDCGISFKNYHDLKKGDELEAYSLSEVTE